MVNTWLFVALRGSWVATLEHGVDIVSFCFFQGGNRVLEHNALILNVAHEARGKESVSKRCRKGAF